MSEARRLPGQSILQRLGARGIQRPQIGATAGFYERFGLADPWTVEERWLDDNEKSPFYFLSAAPYYARLRAMGRAARARRRILDRVESEPFALKGLMGRASAGIAVALPARVGAAASFGMRTVDMGSMHSLSPRASAELFFEAHEASGSDGFAARAPVARRRAGSVSAVRQQLAEIAPLVRTEAQRRTLKRAIEEIELLPAQDQVHAARRVVRRIKGPASRIATSMVERTVERADVAPAAVARSRSLPHIGKGLRRIMGATPSMATLVQDAPMPSTAPEGRSELRTPSRTRSVEAVRPSATPVAVSRAVREARAQLQTGRAGPPEVEATFGQHSVVGPARVTRTRPTARAMSRALSAPTTPSIDTRRGFRASMPAPATSTSAVVRAAERVQAGVRVDSYGTPFVAPSATSYVPAHIPARATASEPRETVAPRALEAGPASVAVRTRRSRAVASEPSSWLRPGAVEADRPGVSAGEVTSRAPAPARAMPTASARRAGRVASAPSVVPSRGTLAPQETLAGASQLVPPVSTPPAARAALRAEPMQRRDTAGRALLAPAPVAHVPSATVRRSRLVSPVTVAIAPTEFLETAPGEAAAAASPSAPVARRAFRAPGRGDMAPSEAVAPARPGAPVASPVVRAAARGETAPTARIAIAREPMAHVRAAHAESVVRPRVDGVAAPALERRSATRRSRVLAPTATPVQPVGAEEESVRAEFPTPAEPGRTAVTRELASPRRATRASESAPTLRAVARSVRDVARDADGSEVVVAQPTRYVRASSDPLQAAATRSAAVVERVAERADGGPAAPTSVRVAAEREDSRPDRAPTRRSRVVAPDGVLPETATDVQESAVQAVAASTVSRPPRVRASRSTAHAVRRVVHAARELAPVASLPERVMARKAASASTPAASGPAARPTQVASVSETRRSLRGARRSLMPRAVAPITLAIPSFGDAEPVEPTLAPRVRGAQVAARVPPRLSAEPSVNVDAVVERVSSAIRAALRGDQPTVVLDASRRVLRVRTELPEVGPLERAGDRLGTPVPVAPRFAPASPGQSLADPLGAYEQLLAEGGEASVAAPGRRAFPAVASAPVRSASQAGQGARTSPGSVVRRSSPSVRVLGRRYPDGEVAPRWTRVRSDGKVVRVPAAERSETRMQTQQRAPRAAARADLLRTGAGFGSPSLESLPQPMASLNEEGDTARPLARTLGQMDPARAPLPGSPTSPGWAQRAVHGTAATTREQIRASRMLRQDGGLFTALARSSTAEEVIRVILERGDSASAVRDELGAPAAAMVERIVRMRRDVADTDGVLQPGRPAQAAGPDQAAQDMVGGAPLPGQTRRSRSVRGMSTSAFLAGAPTSDGVGASNVMKLAGKLQQLIHLAETERRLSDAQAQVRMSQEQVSESTAASGPMAGSEDETPDIGALQRDVLHAVMTELESFKMRSPSNPDGPDRW